MSIVPNDYVIIKESLGKPTLIKATDVDTKTVSGFLERDIHLTKKSVQTKRSNVLINLGPDPHPGKVYGVDVDLIYRRTLDHDFWGPIHWFVKPDKQTVQALKLALDRSAKKLSSLRLDKYVDRAITEIYPKKGKWAGKYIHSPKDNLSRVRYAPEWAQGDQHTLQYVVYHEYGHLLRFNGLRSPKIRSVWLKAYGESISGSSVSKSETQSYLDLVLEADPENVSLGQALLDVVDSDDLVKAKVKTILRYIREVHRLAPKDLQTIWEAGDTDYLRRVWPDTGVDFSTLSPEITEYSTLNVEEFFAEAFAYYVMSKKIPPKVEKLLERSLEVIRANA